MAVDRTRKIISAEAESISFEYTSIGSLLETFKRLNKEYGPEAEIQSCYYPYDNSDSKYFAVFAKRPETDKEMNKRIAQEEVWQKEQDERDRRDFERLKLKFK